MSKLTLAQLAELYNVKPARGKLPGLIPCPFEDHGEAERMLAELRIDTWIALEADYSEAK
jgi:hypothetical protein